MKHLGFSATMKGIKRKKVEATAGDEGKGKGVDEQATKAKAKESTSKRPPATKAKATAKPREATEKVTPKRLVAELDGCLPPLGSFQGLYSDSD